MNWNQFSLRTKLLLGIGILVAGYITSVAVGFVYGASQERALGAVGQISVPVSLKCQSALFEFEGSAKAFTDATMTGEEETLKEAAAHNGKTIAIVEEIRRLAEAAGLPAAELTALRTALAGLDATRTDVFKAMTAGATAKAAVQQQAQSLTAGTDQLRQQLTRLSSTAASQLDAHLAASTGQIRQQRYANLILAAIIITFGCGTLLAIIQRAVMRPVSRVTVGLGESSQKVEAAAGTVRESGHRLAAGASQQAASLEETSATLEEISGGAKRNAEHAHIAKQRASEACAAAERGAAEVGTMRAATNEIKEASDSIAKIVKAIDEIAFQTNILALNAAVEAARAGDAGMGFAVVAEEVRTLARRSADAARETATLIENSIEKSRRGVAISARVATNLEEIGTKIREADGLIAEIATASAEQSTGVSQVNDAVVQLNELTQSNAASAEESASAAEEMTAQAVALRAAVSELQALVSGAADAKPDAPMVNLERGGQAVRVVRPRLAPSPRPVVPPDANPSLRNFTDLPLGRSANESRVNLAPRTGRAPNLT